LIFYINSRCVHFSEKFDVSLSSF